MGIAEKVENAARDWDEGLPEREFCTPTEAFPFVHRRTGISKATFFRRVKRGYFPVRDIGGKRMLDTRRLGIALASE